VQVVCLASVMVTVRSLLASVTMRLEFVIAHTTHMVVIVSSVMMAITVIHGQLCSCLLIISGISHVTCQDASRQSLHSSFIMADISDKFIIFVNYLIISLHVVCAHVICAASFRSLMCEVTVFAVFSWLSPHILGWICGDRIISTFT